MPGGEAAWALADCQAWRSGAVSRPSPSNSRAVAARCSSPSRIWPRRANALSRSSWTRGSKGASWSHCSRYGNASSSGSALDEMLEQGGVAAAESPALGGEPAVEDRAAADLQALEELAAEQRGQRPLPVRWELLDAFAGRAGHLDRVDETVREVEPHGVAAGLDALLAALVDQAPDLAETPAELAARVVRHVPEELAQLAPRRGPRRQGQIGEQRPHLAGRRERHGGAPPPDRQAPEQPDVDRGRRPGPAQPGEFLGNSHGGYHGGSHVGPLRSGSTVTARRWSGARMTAVADARRSIEGRRGEMTWTQAP